MKIEFEQMNAKLIGVEGISVMSHQAASQDITTVDNAIISISRRRSAIGSYQNRLAHAYANNRNAEENIQAAESRIRDTDMSTETVDYSKNSILEQAGQAMLAQANQMNKGAVDTLLG